MNRKEAWTTALFGLCMAIGAGSCSRVSDSTDPRRTDPGATDTDTQGLTDTVTPTDTGTGTGTGTESESVDTATDTSSTVDTDTSTTDTASVSDTTTATGTGTSDTDTSTVDIGADWTTIPGGSFWMGTPNGNCPADYTGPGGAACASELGRITEEELHYVTLTYAFEIMRTEVTQAQFNDLLKYNPSKFGPSGEQGNCGDDCPVENVTWHEALAYANALSAKQGLDSCFNCTGTLATVSCSLKGSYSKPQDCPGYRLPTESEWEFAARAGTLTAFYNGDITSDKMEDLDPNLDEIAWYGRNSYSATSSYICAWYNGATICGTHPVAGKTPNDWGLYDMLGNVWEWVWDWYQVAYPAGTTQSPLLDPVGGASSEWRMVRGGSWMADPQDARAGRRDKRYPDYRGANYGFRLVRSLP